MTDDKNKQLFLSLIYSFQMQTMMQLGKLSNPMTGKIERELDGAQVTIDMLDMLKAKTKGNINDDEGKFLNQIIADLKLNYVEERDKEKSDSKNIEDKKTSSSEENENKEKPTSEIIEDKKTSSIEEKESKVKTGSESTDDERPSSSQNKESNEKAGSKNTEGKKQSSSKDKESKEKPDADQLTDSDNSLPPQE